MKLYNTMSRTKEEFIPLEPGKVKMYACGPTVYNFFHLGNARPFVTFDTLRRYLEFCGYQVEFCQNFTDIDDKMIVKANQEDITIRELADRYIAEYYIDADKLKILRPTYQPRATESMDGIIQMISTLVSKGYAYELEDGVYYEASKFAEYGKLSHVNIDELREGASDRVTQGIDKHSYMDFALWKKARPGEPSWDSPWGKGRPGWHIECSAMIAQYLGKTIDIHGGGQDLVFPHHENEIAQSEAANDAVLAKYWLHNGFINIDNEKMSKSANNFFTVRDIVKEYSYAVIRFFILSGHYRMPINFSGELLQAAQNGLERISTSVTSLRFVGGNKSRVVTKIDEPAKLALVEGMESAKHDFMKAMDDDLNTADAVTAIFELVRIANVACTQNGVPSELLLQGADLICQLSEVLGLEVQPVADESDSIPADVMELVAARTEAKKAKDFTLSDKLRDQVVALGYQIKDTAQGPQVLKL